jgi:single-stranded-DNA-specific exonuclease
LVITVDCGITAFAEVEQAQREGLDIIITDHHSVPISIPPAIAVIDPKRNDSDYIFCELAGVGVAFKLLEALFQTAGKERMLDEFLDLVALGTVADLVPLRGENRYLVKRGLEVLNASNRPGLRELVHQAGLEMGHLDTESISYMLGPRLNAAGRLEHGITSFKLLTVNSVEEGRQLAAELEAKNAERQRLTLEVLAEAKERLLPITPDTPLLIVGSQNFPPGVMGLVAGKLVDEFCRPAVVMEFTAETTRGSARSISEFDITSALSECSDLLSSFGGHTKAAGFTLPNANVERLQQRLLEIAKRELANFDFSPTLTIDAEIPLSSVGGETFNLVNKLAPFGQANPLPTFLSRRVKAVEHHCVGSKGEHLKLKLQDGRFAKVTWDAIGFDLGYLNNSLTPYLDIVYNLEKDNWRGEFLRLNLLDLSPIVSPSS